MLLGSWNLSLGVWNLVSCLLVLGIWNLVSCLLVLVPIYHINSLYKKIEDPAERENLALGTCPACLRFSLSPDLRIFLLLVSWFLSLGSWNLSCVSSAKHVSSFACKCVSFSAACPPVSLSPGLLVSLSPVP